MVGKFLNFYTVKHHLAVLWVLTGIFLSFEMNRLRLSFWLKDLFKDRCLDSQDLFCFSLLRLSFAHFLFLFDVTLFSAFVIGWLSKLSLRRCVRGKIWPIIGLEPKVNKTEEGDDWIIISFILPRIFEQSQSDFTPIGGLLRRCKILHI